MDCDGEWLVFNSLTCALAKIDENTKRLLRNPDPLIEHSELFNELKKGGYAIEDDVDETQVLNFYRLKDKFNSNISSITIAVTLSCNFSCVYCFEEHRPVFISDAVKDAIYSKVEGLAKSGINIKITWYGGEPLIAKASIWEMSKKLIDICEKYDVSYTAVIVTNAYLLDKETILNMKKYKIAQVQTTLDGPEEIHNSMRKLLGNNPEGTFERIVNNLKLAVENDLKIHIRIHINKINKEKLSDLLSLLKNKGLNSCAIDLGQIKPYTENCKCIVGDCLDTENFAKQSLYYQPIFEKYGFEIFCFDYPSSILSYCRKSHNVNNFIIGPSGELYSCWVEVGDENLVIGSIFEEKYTSGINSHELSYFMWSPFDYEACTDCNILPICMGGCTHCSKQTNKPDCQMWKYILKDILIGKYEKCRSVTDNDRAINYVVYPKLSVNRGI